MIFRVMLKETLYACYKILCRRQVARAGWQMQFEEIRSDQKMKIELACTERDFQSLINMWRQSCV